MTWPTGVSSQGLVSGFISNPVGDGIVTLVVSLSTPTLWGITFPFLLHILVVTWKLTLSLP